MEKTNYWKIIIEQDTNKGNYCAEYDDLVVAVKYILADMNDDDRLELFSDYCTHCGRDDHNCQCWNDE